MNKCIDCGKETKGFGKRCHSCEAKRRHKLGILKSQGKNNPFYIDGRTLVQHSCIECNKEISKDTDLYGKRRCASCAKKGKRNVNSGGISLKHKINISKARIKLNLTGNKSSMFGVHRFGKDNPMFGKHQSENAKNLIRINTIKNIKLGKYHFKPNKPETFLIDLFKQLSISFKYVGDGKFWIKFKKFNFCPDFIDIKNKKIIELYGDYWHNRKDNKKRDKIRIKGYKNQNYKTLIIWEHELKNIDKLINKLLKFDNLSL